MDIPYVFKRCNKCGRWLVASSTNFYKRKNGKYGLRARCKKCDNKRNKKYYDKNKEAEAERSKKYRETLQGQVTVFNIAIRRRAKEQNQGSGITKEQWLEMMNFFNWECAYSGEKLTKKTRSIDHIIPLNNGGENEIWNCVPMDRSLNSSKHDKDMLEWYTKQPFYSHERLLKISEWQEYAKNKILKK